MSAHRRLGVVLGVIATLVAIALVVSMKPSTNGESTTLGVARADDETVPIKAAILGGITTLQEGCIQSSHGDEASYKSELEQYYSPSSRVGDALSTREATFDLLYPTPDPIFIAQIKSDAGTSVASAAIPPGKATAIAEYVPATPWWEPETSILDEHKHLIDSCQEDYGTDFPMATVADVGTIEYNSINIVGNSATVQADSTCLPSGRSRGGGS